MAETHFSRLRRALDLEAEAEGRELAQQARVGTGVSAERSGTCLTGLVIRDETTGFGGRVVLTLGKRDRRQVLPWHRFQSGSPVYLIEEHPKASDGLRGVVTRRDPETLTIAVTESIEPLGDRPTFQLKISSDEVARQRQRDALRRASQHEKKPFSTLRDVLLGESEPTFAAQRDWTPFSALDQSQRDAVDWALRAEQLAVIHGPPGTGKTTTVIEIIRQAVSSGQRVLACAASNLAVDNLVERLAVAGVKVLRLGHPARVLPELQSHTLDVQVETHPDLKLAREWTKEAWSLRRQAGKYLRTAPQPGARRELREQANQLLDDARRLEQRLVEHLLDGAEVLCATLTGIDDDLLRGREFDLVVIDEAAQATEPPCWIPLLRTRKVVLAGDHQQLPPTILSNEARRAGLSVSLLERMVQRWGDKISRLLQTQYRMHHDIMLFSSGEFYHGQLQAAATVAEHVIGDLAFVKVPPDENRPLKFIDTAGSGCDETTEPEGTSRQNPGEAQVVCQRVNELLDWGIDPTQIAVITPYAAQARFIESRLANPAVEVDTVDGFQGREKEVIVISLVRSNATGEVGFLADTRRMNVALTRARRKLIVIGDSSTLASNEFYLRLLDYFEVAEAYGTVWDQGDFDPPV